MGVYDYVVCYNAFLVIFKIAYHSVGHMFDVSSWKLRTDNMRNSLLYQLTI